MGIGSHPGGRETGARRPHNVAAVGAREAFRHLAAAAIANADEQDSLAVCMQSHSLARNKLVNARIRGELGMKGGHQVAALLHQHRIALIVGQHVGASVPTRRMMGARMKTASISPGCVRD